MRELLTNTLMAAGLLPAFSQANICDRTPQVRDAILEEVVNIINCAGVDSFWLTTVKALELNYLHLTTLRAGDFDGLTNLQQLRLDNKLPKFSGGEHGTI